MADPSPYSYCCRARQRFVLGIVGENPEIELGVEVADLVVRWEPKILLRIRFCPFCGVAIDGRQPLRIAE